MPASACPFRGRDISNRNARLMVTSSGAWGCLGAQARNDVERIGLELAGVYRVSD
jgi:hypothetical protein